MQLPQTDGLLFVGLAPVSATGPVLGAGVIHVYFEIYTVNGPNQFQWQLSRFVLEFCVEQNDRERGGLLPSQL